MSVIDAIAEKCKRLSPEAQNEVLRYVEQLAEKPQPQVESETVKMSFSWAGALASQNQTALEVQKEILQKRDEL